MPLDVVMLNDEPEEGERNDGSDYDPMARHCGSDPRRLFRGSGNIEPLRPPQRAAMVEPQPEHYRRFSDYKRRAWVYDRWLLGYQRQLEEYRQLVAEGAKGYCKTCGILVRANGVPDDSVMPCDLIDCPFEGRGPVDKAAVLDELQRLGQEIDNTERDR